MILVSLCKSLNGLSDEINLFRRCSSHLNRFPLFAILTRNISSKLSSLCSCQYVSTIPEKNCVLPTFQKWTFCRVLYGENDGSSIQGKRHEKHIYSRKNQMTAYVECSTNQ